jgi:hypothetical protein
LAGYDAWVKESYPRHYSPPLYTTHPPSTLLTRPSTLLTHSPLHISLTPQHFSLNPLHYLLTPLHYSLTPLYHTFTPLHCSLFIGTLLFSIGSELEPSTGSEAAPGDVSVSRKMGGRAAPETGLSEQWLWIRMELGLVNWDIVTKFILLGGCISMTGAWLMTLMLLRRARRCVDGRRAQRSGMGGALAEPLIFATAEEVAGVKLAAPVPVATKEGVEFAADYIQHCPPSMY